MNKNDVTLTLISSELQNLRLEYTQNLTIIADAMMALSNIKFKNIELAEKIKELENTAFLLKGE